MQNVTISYVMMAQRTWPPKQRILKIENDAGCKNKILKILVIAFLNCVKLQQINTAQISKRE